MGSQPDSARRSEVANVQERYAARIKQRLAQPSIDVAAARDGILDCYVATYFGGLKQGIGGYLGIDASEEQVARVAEALFRKRLKQHGSAFEAPSVEALDRVKQEVDHELHFEELPGELRGLHDQVCSLMLSKADGTLDHAGDRSVVRRPSEPTVTGSEPPLPAVQGGLRDALSTYLMETASAVNAGAPPSELRARVAKIQRLVEVVDDFA